MTDTPAELFWGSFYFGGRATQFLGKSLPLCISAAHFGRKGAAEDDRTCQSTMCPGKSRSQAGMVSAVILASNPRMTPQRTRRRAASPEHHLEERHRGATGVTCT